MLMTWVWMKKAHSVTLPPVSAYAQLHKRAETFKYIEAAERQATDQSAILMATGDALLTLGDRSAAMDRFTRALEAPDANRLAARYNLVVKRYLRSGAVLRVTAGQLASIRDDVDAGDHVAFDVISVGRWGCCWARSYCA